MNSTAPVPAEVQEPDGAGEARQGMPPGRKRMLLVLLALAVIGGIGWFLDYHFRGRYFEDTNNAYVHVDQVAISSKLAGFVTAVPVADNAVVHAGALLVSLDPADYRTRAASADASIAAALSQGQVTSATLAEALAAIGEAEAGVRAARADLDYAAREVVRYTPLAASGAEPREKLSQHQAGRDRATAQLDARQAQLDIARRRIATITAQEGQARAQAGLARAEKEAATNDLSRTVLKAPLAGRVADRSVRVGQFVQPGVRLMTLVPLKGVYVEANFKETQVGLMRPGQPAEVRIDALPDVAFHGVVESITPGTGANFSLIPPENATGNFTKIVQRVPVRIRLEPLSEAARRALVPGLSVEVEVDTRSGREELEALRAEQERGAGPKTGR
jgi:membrane fusion protein (multidrug efflux system)